MQESSKVNPVLGEVERLGQLFGAVEGGVKGVLDLLLGACQGGFDN